MLNTVDRFKMVKNRFEDWEIYDLEEQERLVVLSKKLGEEISRQIMNFIDLSYPDTPIQNAVKEYKTSTKKEETKYKKLEDLIEKIVSRYDVKFFMDISHNESYDFVLNLAIDEENETIIDKIDEELSKNGFGLMEKTNSELKYLI